MNVSRWNYYLAACLGLLVWAWVSPAVAQSDPAAAQALFDAAKRLMDAGSYAEACPKLAESQRLDPAGGTLLNLAICQEKLGQTATAWESYKHARDLSRREQREDRAALAQEYLDAVEPKLSRLTIEVPAGARAEGLLVTRNGVEVGSAAWGLAIPTDPGEIVIEAKAPGHEPWSQRVVLGAEHDAKTVQVPVLPATAASSAAKAPAPIPDPGGADSGAGSGQRVAGIVVAGIGGVAAVVGGVIGGLALAAESDANELCGSDEDTCPSAAGVEASDTARTYAKAANGLIFGGLGLAAAGIIIAVAAPSGATETAGLLPWVDAGGAGLTWQVAW